MQGRAARDSTVTTESRWISSYQYRDERKAKQVPLPQYPFSQVGTQHRAFNKSQFEEFHWLGHEKSVMEQRNEKNA